MCRVKKFLFRNLAVSILFASSTISNNSFAQTTDDNEIEYVNFLDVLPNALELDEGIKLAEFGKLAAMNLAWIMVSKS